jgi:hypothetical protein
MNRRIIKKLSKRIAEILPDRYAHAFIDGDSDSDTYGMLCVCGFSDDIVSVFESFYSWLPWEICPLHEDGNELEHYPNTKGFKFKGIHIIKYAKQIREQTIAGLDDLVSYEV